MDDESQDCIICLEEITLYGIGHCGHSNICARCQYKLRVKQQKLECGYCKKLNQFMLVTPDKLSPAVKAIERAERSGNPPEGLIEYREGSIFFESQALQDQFEETICCVCPYCPTKTVFLDAEEYKNHLVNQHWRFLW